MFPTNEVRPTILAIHGSASTGKQWRFLAEALDGVATVHAPDLPGYGQAANDDEDRLKCLLRCLGANLDRVHVIGHSFGGAVAARLANEYPDRIASVTLFDPISVIAGHGGHALPLELATLFGEARLGPPHRLMNTFIDYWNGSGSWDRLSDGQKERLLRHRPGLMRDMLEITSGRWTSMRGGYLGPVRILRGARSPRITADMAQTIAQALPQARIEVLPQLGHLSPLTEPAMTLPHLLDALTDHGAVGGVPAQPAASRAA